MSDNLREVVSKLSDSERIKLIQQYEQFEKDCYIGDCELRTIASQIQKNESTILITMTIVAFECYRYFAKQHIAKL